MLTETLQDGLDAYRIGPKIRALRLEKGLALAELGAQSGLSSGMLSKVERGQVCLHGVAGHRVVVPGAVVQDRARGAQR